MKDILEKEAADALHALDKAKNLTPELETIAKVAHVISETGKWKLNRIFLDSLGAYCTKNSKACIVAGIATVGGVSLWTYLSGKEHKELMTQGLHPTQLGAEEYKKEKKKHEDEETERMRKNQRAAEEGAGYGPVADPKIQDMGELEGLDLDE